MEDLTKIKALNAEVLLENGHVFHVPCIVWQSSQLPNTMHITVSVDTPQSDTLNDVLAKALSENKNLIVSLLGTTRLHQLTYTIDNTTEQTHNTIE